MNNTKKHQNITLITWSDYLYMGLLYAVLMTVVGEESDGFYELIFFALFFILSGVKDNLDLLKRFSREHIIFTIATVMSTVFFAFIYHPEIVSFRFAPTVYFLVFGGYCIALHDSECVKDSMIKLWGVLLVLVSSAMIKYIFIDHFVFRMNLYFMNPIPDATAAVVLMMISLFFIDKKLPKLIGVAIALAGIVLTATRSLLLLVAVVLLAYALIVAGDSKISKKNLRRISFAALTLGIILVAGLSLFIIKTNMVAITNVTSRFATMLEAFRQDPYLNYFGDIGFRYRIVAPVEAIRLARSGNVLEILFGRGLKSTFNTIGTNTTILSQNDIAGPVENAFICLLSDFGVVCFVMYLGIYIAAIRSFIKSRTKQTRILAAFVIIVMSTTLFADLHYWANIAYFTWVFAGLWLGAVRSEKDIRSVSQPFAFSAVVAIILYQLPRTYTWLRTVITSTTDHLGGLITALFLTLLILAVGTIIWNVCGIIITLISDRQMDNRSAVGLAVGVVVTALLVVFGNVQTRITYTELTWQMDAEEDVITAIQSGAEGDIYCDTYPALYNKRFGNIKGTLFSGASLATMQDTTVIMNTGVEAQRLTNEGFFYQPISQWAAVYTNDQGAITALKNLGYAPSEFFPASYEVSLDDVAAGNSVEVLPGQYTASFSLRKLNEEQPTGDNIVGSIEIVSKDPFFMTEEQLAAADITGNMFDENGSLTCDLNFTGGGANYYFLVHTSAPDLLEIESVSYTRTGK